MVSISGGVAVYIRARQVGYGGGVGVEHESGKTKNHFFEPMYLLSADIPKAFDRLQHGVMAAAMQWAGVPRCQISWLLRHTRRMEVSFAYGGYQSRPVRLRSGIPQGDTWPRAFTTTPGYVLDALWQELFLEGIGVHVADGTVFCI